jgi:mannose-6-phosphate isomerase-like protein (cupin superfamily)
MTESRPFETVELPDMRDEVAPDGSEIHMLGRVAGASLAHGTLPPGAVSRAVAHRTVEELWYVLEGEAEIWRRLSEREEVTTLRPGVAITIPLGTRFQLRTVGTTPFRFLMCTSPPWPGDDEAVEDAGTWPPPEPAGP